MKISYNNWAYTSFFVWAPAYTLDETIKRLAAIGYDGIEIGAGAPHAFPAQLTPDRRSQVRDLLQEHGIACSSMLPAPSGGPGNNPCSPLAEERAYAVAHYRELIDLCEQWGAPKLIYLPGWRVFGTTRRQAWQWSREALTQIAEYAGEHGVTLVIEPTSHDTNMCESSYDAIELMEDVGSPNVKLMFDTFHVLYRREVISDYVYEMGSDLEHIHIADNDRLPPGHGRGDFPAMMDALIETGFDGYLTMETGFHERGIEPDRDARLCLEYMRPLVESKLGGRDAA
ncbi:MAG: sugar phosphate isomerase/epimerase family protein [Solirubrobacterales bacterium]